MFILKKLKQIDIVLHTDRSIFFLIYFLSITHHTPNKRNHSFYSRLVPPSIKQSMHSILFLYIQSLLHSMPIRLQALSIRGADPLGYNQTFGILPTRLCTELIHDHLCPVSKSALPKEWKNEKFYYKIGNRGGNAEICTNQRSHSFHDRYRARHYTGIMSPLCFQHARRAVVGDCFLGLADRGWGLEADAEVDWFAVCDAALDAAGMIRFHSEDRFTV